jgi:hypothetical protein
MRVSIDRHMYIYLDGFASSWLPRPATAKRGRFAPCLEIEGFRDDGTTDLERCLRRSRVISAG